MYEVVTDEERIEGLTFSTYRRIATTIRVPVKGAGAAIEMLSHRLSRSCERTSCRLERRQ